MKQARKTLEKRVEVLTRALLDFRDWGGRFDPNPTTSHRVPRCNRKRECSSSQSEIHTFYQQYLAGVDASIRDRAAAALEEAGWVSRRKR